MARPTYTFITEEAVAPARTWTVSDLLSFHYFNPNGLYAAKKATDDLITAAVAAGKCKNGAILAYGSLNYHSTDKLASMVRSKHDTRITRRQLHVALYMLERDIESAKKFLASLD